MGLMRPRVSPDGDHVAVQIGPDVWVYDLVRGGGRRVTLNGAGADPVWTADGAHVTYRGSRGDPVPTYYTAPVDGSADEELLIAQPTDQGPQGGGHSWSPDGRIFAFYAGEPRSIYTVSPEGDRTVSPFLVRSLFNDRSPLFSPDGRWLAYVSDESGEDEVYVTPYPGPGPRHQVSTDGGREPVWSRETPELFYRKDDQILAVELELEPVFRAGTPEPLFSGEYFREPIRSGSLSYDVHPSGERFIMVKSPTGDSAVAQTGLLQFVSNWTEELKRLVPTND